MSMPLHLQSRLMQRGQGAASFMRLPRRALPTLPVEKQKQFINSVAVQLKSGSVTGGLRKRYRQARRAVAPRMIEWVTIERLRLGLRLRL